MTRFALNERVRLSIELALTAADDDAPRRQQQDIDARRLGLSGAEIDAARQRWSFEVTTSIAIALAVAARAGDDVQRHAQRERARKAGIGEDICRDIEALATRYPSRASRKVKSHA